MNVGHDSLKNVWDVQKHKRQTGHVCGINVGKVQVKLLLVPFLR